MDKKEKWNLELSEYIKQGEPNRVEKTKTWETAIGLQDVDGLKPSKYLIKTAKEHIEGNIDIEEVKTRIDEYYEVQGSRKNFEKENEEAGFILLEKMKQREHPIPVIICSSQNYRSPDALGTVWYNKLRDIEFDFKEILENTNWDQFQS